MSADVEGRRLFVAALGNDTVEVVDLKAGRRTRSLKGVSEPQGVAFVADAGTLFVANGASGAVSVFDGTSLDPVGSVAFGKDAANLRYDPGRHRLYVGYGDGALASIDTTTGKRNDDEVKLAGHPESFQLEAAGSRVFVNVPDAAQIAVVDRASRRVIGTWPSKDMRANFPSALDEPDHRLFVGFRSPATLAAYDTESGRLITSVDCPGDLDDVFYDADRKRLYLTGGAGFVDVVSQRDADRYERVARLATAPGARTSLWVAPLDRLYVAVPHRGEQRAEIQVYEAP
jgi:DNA-binding beta-propeller fold protein YncE